MLVVLVDWMMVMVTNERDGVVFWLKKVTVMLVTVLVVAFGR